GKSLGVADGQVLHPAVGVVHQPGEIRGPGRGVDQLVGGVDDLFVGLFAPGAVTRVAVNV
ncbi:MAG TPA: hypothetical protein VE196_13800, partial [Pseudonocardiaceae bacterium]|nr:hypothetical protein [Pseudonocardiaceae bacterium]